MGKDRSKEMQDIVDGTAGTMDIEQAGRIISDTINGTVERAKKLKREEIAFLFASLATHYALFAPEGYKDWMDAVLYAATSEKR